MTEAEVGDVARRLGGAIKEILKKRKKKEAKEGREKEVVKEKT